MIDQEHDSKYSKVHSFKIGKTVELISRYGILQNKVLKVISENKYAYYVSYRQALELLKNRSGDYFPDLKVYDQTREAFINKN